jgi:hypothetical protein
MTPKDRPEIDFAKYAGNTTVRVPILGGGTHIYLEVATLQIGEQSFTGKGEAKKTITFHAKKRKDL